MCLRRRYVRCVPARTITGADLPRYAGDRTHSTPTGQGRSSAEFDADLFAAAACAGDPRYSDADSVRDAVPLVAFGCMACPVKVATRCGEVAVEIGASTGVWNGWLYAYNGKPRDMRAKALELMDNPRKVTMLPKVLVASKIRLVREKACIKP